MKKHTTIKLAACATIAFMSQVVLPLCAAELTHRWSFNGDLYRLISPYKKPLAALMYASETKDAAVLFALGLKIDGKRTETFKLRGLDPDARYSFREINCGN